MLSQEDLKIILAFTDRYENLYEKDKISAQQRDRILSLLDKYEDYSYKEFKQELSSIFPEIGES